jgi:uncharacterized membrane protein YidH (DUF202 family)
MILSLILLGVIILILGVIFYSQSKALVGPKRSFMYNNPSWTSKGFIVILLGVSLLVMGFLLYFDGKIVL